MKIFVAEHSGFCYGVRRAMNILQDIEKKGEEAYTLGPIVHNPQVVEYYSKKGIIPIEIDELENMNKKRVIIRTHGVEPKVIEMLKEKGIDIIDATCPFVKRVQKLAQEITDKGLMLIIIGEKNHPEVIGIKGYCKGKCIVVENKDEAKAMDNFDKAAVVVQTTQTQENVSKIMDILKQKGEVVEFYNTRCDATTKRQDAARKLAGKVNVMLVVGGKNSANTKKLALICEREGAKVFHIETADEIKKEWFNYKDQVGITAGASTPDWIIKEVINKMEEIAKELNENNNNNNQLNIQKGQIVEGTVVKVTEKEVIVDIGAKQDGIIPLNEISYKPASSPHEFIKEGDKIKVFVLNPEDKEGNLVLSKKRADFIIGWEKIEKAFNEKETVEATVEEIVRGGALAEVFNLRAFIPASHMDIKYVSDLSSYIGQTLNFKIIEIDKEKKRIVLSRKAYLEEEREKTKNQIWNKIKEGDVVTGIVKRLTDFGAFVDIGGYDGLIHISDLSFKRVSHPSEILTVGQEVKVKVLKVDKEKGKVSLGLKQLAKDPWAEADKKYKEGMIFEGKVVKLAKFGAFVELEPGVEGLVHLSQISNQKIKNPQEVLKVGDKVKVKVLEVNTKNKRISLSIKEALEENATKKVEEVKEEIKEEGLKITIGEIFGDLLKKSIQ
ncbi:MAG: bifunctional 4-hydroxy-3-methylbut-2-enyl diphosphate reductase/30S ribosomal protein S1 [Thermovenabulum sp.]|uniref:bifunctional 4-hydroxy-3-methylbut-2-enyl diphosphate reductase/30S ribosomal protein S1 n=1 Tax=Thermovenabulum sp. TaxID=3100335 RepID=UPI003C79D332